MKLLIALITFLLVHSQTTWEDKVLDSYTPCGMGDLSKYSDMNGKEIIKHLCWLKYSNETSYYDRCNTLYLRLYGGVKLVEPLTCYVQGAPDSPVPYFTRGSCRNIFCIFGVSNKSTPHLFCIPICSHDDTICKPPGLCNGVPAPCLSVSHRQCRFLSYYETWVEGNISEGEFLPIIPENSSPALPVNQ